MTLSDAEMLEIFDRELRRECVWSRMRREVLPGVVRHIPEGAGTGEGLISWSNLNDRSADTEIERQMAYFKGLGIEVEWDVYSHDQPADLAERLTARGFTPAEPGAQMVIDLNDVPRDFWDVDTSMVQRVMDHAGVDAIMVMENEVWGRDISHIAPGLKHDMVEHPELLSIYAVRDGGRVVSAAWTWFLQPTSFAGLWGGSTLKEYRKRGYYRALLAVRAREARDRGCRFLHVDAGPESQPILARNGFRCLCTMTPYEWKAGSQM